MYTNASKYDNDKVYASLCYYRSTLHFVMQNSKRNSCISGDKLKILKEQMCMPLLIAKVQHNTSLIAKVQQYITKTNYCLHHINETNNCLI